MEIKCGGFRDIGVVISRLEGRCGTWMGTKGEVEYRGQFCNRNGFCRTVVGHLF